MINTREFPFIRCHRASKAPHEGPREQTDPDYRLSHYIDAPGIQYCKKLWLGLGIEVTYNSPCATLSDILVSIWALI